MVNEIENAGNSTKGGIQARNFCILAAFALKSSVLMGGDNEKNSFEKGCTYFVPGGAEKVCQGIGKINVSHLFVPSTCETRGKACNCVP